MTKEEILKAFAADETFAARTGLSEAQITNIRFSERTNSKLVEVIKLAIDGIIKNESEGVIARKIHTSLNK